ncbi:MAG: sigma-70 family RNA polymerase sigma factor [Myxococcales bacterium]|nr:sigma-70 family RNA polymerase sigma factor [Myxococcales bacterium]
MQRNATAAQALAAPAPPTPLQDSQQDSQRDSQERLRSMFDLHHHVVWRTLRRFGLDPEAAADVGQQAYLVAVERIDDIWPGSERAFLIGTALRLARKHRHRAGRLQLEATVDERLHAPGKAESRAIALELLDRVLSQLDPSLVEAFVLFDIEGLSTREVARALDLPEGTVASRVRRAREAFRAATRRLDRISQREEGGR